MKAILLLSLSNVFMTFAWYANLKDLRDKPWIIAALISWGVALFGTCCRYRRTAPATASSISASSR